MRAQECSSIYSICIKCSSTQESSYNLFHPVDKRIEVLTVIHHANVDQIDTFIAYISHTYVEW